MDIENLWCSRNVAYIIDRVFGEILMVLAVE